MNLRPLCLRPSPQCLKALEKSTRPGFTLKAIGFTGVNMLALVERHIHVPRDPWKPNAALCVRKPEQMVHRAIG